jgi:membrane-associated protease RseP (regulator of RpoE activity)
MNIVIALALLGIVIALAFAGRALLQDGRDGKPKSNRMVKALAVRVGLSIALFLFILVSYKMGWIQPTGIPTAR